MIIKDNFEGLVEESAKIILFLLMKMMMLDIYLRLKYCVELHMYQKSHHMYHKTPLSTKIE